MIAALKLKVPNGRVRLLQTGKMTNRDDIEGFMETKEQETLGTGQRKGHSVAEVDGTYRCILS